MAFEKNPMMLDLNGVPVRMYPFHISMKGLESLVICRDEEDYDAFVKILHVKGHKYNVHRVMYCVVSNHSHMVVLSESKDIADKCCLEIKRSYSMYLHHKYGIVGALKGLDIQVLYLDSLWYLRNALVYTIRNAYDNGAENALEYKWSGARALFCGGKIGGKTRRVADLTRDETREIMHSHESLKKTGWILNSNNELEPASCCLWRYFEKVFNNDHSIFIQKMGNVNIPEMEQRLVENPRNRYNDGEMVKIVNDVSKRWFNLKVSELPVEKKLRLTSYIFRNHKTTYKQLARVMEIDLDTLKKYF